MNVMHETALAERQNVHILIFKGGKMYLRGHAPFYVLAEP